MSNDLRKQLEKAYKAYLGALKAKDPKAFAQAVALPAELLGDDFAREFEEFADSVAAMSPDPAEMRFLAIKTLGDDVAGYYALWEPKEDPKTVCVGLTQFRKTEQGWKVLPGGGVCGFEPQHGQDVQALAMEKVESDPVLELNPIDAQAPQDAYDLELDAVLECFAYDCELDITINGVKLGYRGGDSYGQRLFGVAGDAQPAEPGLLKVGENQIEVKYRKTTDDGCPVTVEVYIQPAGRCLRMAGAKSAGQMSATFIIPRSPTEQIKAEEIQCVEIVDE